MFNDSIFEDKKQELVKINWTFSYTLLEVYINSYIKISTQVQFSSVQSLSRVQLFATPWIAARQASLSITNSQSSLKLTSIKLVMPSSHLILCHPLLLLPPISPSISLFPMSQLFAWVGQSTGCFSIIASKEHPGLISFRMDGKSWKYTSYQAIVGCCFFF